MGLDFMLFYLMALYNNGTLSLAMLHESKEKKVQNKGELGMVFEIQFFWNYTGWLCIVSYF